MRRFSPLLFVFVLALLLPSAALARVHPAHGAPITASSSHGAIPAAPRVGAVERATCTITVRVLDFNNNAVVGARVEANLADYSAPAGTGTTDATGQATVTGTPVTATGVLYAARADGTAAYEVRAQAFSDGAVFVVQPGSVPFTTDTLGVGDHVSVFAFGPTGATYAKLTSTAGPMPAMPASVNYASAYWSAEEGGDWVTTDFAPGSNAPIAVAAGLQSNAQLSLNRSDAKSIWIKSPFWGSGAPGMKVTCELDNWLSPMKAELSVASEKSTVVMPQLPAFTGNASGKRVFSFVVPKKAKPGDTLEVHATRTDLAVPSSARLDVFDYFQVCTLIGSKTSIAKGASVRLSGVVPVGGSAKKVVLYSRTTKATAQPSNWNSPAGWKKIATLSASKTGAYKSGLLKPSRSTWYIVRYPADPSNFAAFTSVLKVAIH